MKPESELVPPHHCFCQIPNEELRPWVEKRYGEHCRENVKHMLGLD